MGSVNVTINGRQFRIACEDGQEQHLEKLATDFDALINDLRGRIGEVGDARLTIMAALTIADDLSEMATKLRVLEEEIAALKEARIASVDRTQATQAAVVAAFNAAAERLEAIAKKLNQGSVRRPLRSDDPTWIAPPDIFRAGSDFRNREVMQRRCVGLAARGSRTHRGFRRIHP